MKLLTRIFAVVLVLAPLSVHSQSAALLSRANDELQKRGLTQAEVEARLLEKGIDANSIPVSDYPRYRTAVMDVVEELEKEKQNVSQPIIQEEGVSEPPVQVMVDVPQYPLEPEPAAIAASAPENAASDNSGIYGHSFFKTSGLDIYKTTDGSQAPDTYILSEGDEVHISIFGASQIELQQRIGREGFIQPVGAAKIYLKGLTLEQARQAARSSLSAYYSFTQDQFAFTLVSARNVVVNVMGETAKTGGFSLSALNSVLNVLTAAGGPTGIGSVRNIQVLRGEEKISIDLYAYMIGQRRNMKLDIRNNDIIYVPTAKKIVAIEGAVNRPLKYELLEKETAKDVIDFAGGITSDAYPEFIQIQSTLKGETTLKEYNLSEVLAGKTKIELENGDIIRIKEVTKPAFNYVTIQGGVYYDGRYDLESNRSLAKLIDNAQLKFTAKTDFLFVERTRPDMTVEVISVPFPLTNGNPDFELQELDQVTVLDQTDYRDVEQITVSGLVRKPFSKNYSLDDKISVKEAIDYAGGLKENAYPVAYIFRTDLTNTRKKEYVEVNLNQAESIMLQPGDELRIYSNEGFTEIGSVTLFGAVNNTVSVAYNNDLTVTNLIFMGGGLDTGAAYNRVEVFRTDFSEKEGVELSTITLSIDSAYNVIQPTDFTLQPYDKVVVRRVPRFNTRSGETVEINGYVRYPGVYSIAGNETLRDVIERAGGFLPEANLYGGVLFRTYKNRGAISVSMTDAYNNNNNKAAKYNPIMFDGDVVNITKRENIVRIMATGTNMSQYTAEDYVQSLTEDLYANNTSSKTIVFAGGKNAAWYVRHYAGGFTKYAKKRTVTVTYPNNQMQGTKTGFLGIRRYPKLVEGSTIALQLNQEKIDKHNKKMMEESKGNTDWDAMFTKTLTTLTSLLSLITIASKL